MEAMSFENYWHSGDGVDGGCTTAFFTEESTATSDTALSPYSSDGEDGPYFDMEFTLPDDESDRTTEFQAESDEKSSGEREKGDETDQCAEGESEKEMIDLRFSVSGCNDFTDDRNVNLFRSGKLLLDGKYVPTEDSSTIFWNALEENCKLPVCLLKSATKFRVLPLKFKRSKFEKSEKNNASGEEETEVKTLKIHENPSGIKLFAVKFKVDEVLSLFSRDNNRKEKPVKGMKSNAEREANPDSEGISDDGKLMHKYLSMMKPFCVRVSKRYVEKLRFSGQLISFSSPKVGGAVSPPPCVAEERVGCDAVEVVEAANYCVKASHNQGNNLQTALKVMLKHLGKSRPAAEAAKALEPASGKMAASDRREESLQQLQDGIQDAILHCKKSFQRP